MAARYGGPVRGFAVAGDDGAYHFADATIDGESAVVVHCPDVPAPRTVRYAWAAVPDANLTDDAGLPAGPFRTDHQPPAAAIEVQPLPAARRVATDLYAVTIDANGNLVGLGVANQQFAANDLDGPGTANFPGYFGPRQLHHVTPLTPESVRFADGGLSVTYAFTPDGMTVAIDDRAGSPKDKLAYRLRLAAAVHAASADGRITAERGNGRVTIVGADRVGPNGTVEMSVDGGSAKVLTFAFARGK